jgi:hypothetical protein
LIGQAVRWWDPDDGWKMGVLCLSCGNDASGRGPREGDYAYRAPDKSERIDALAGLQDSDGTYTDSHD